MKLVAPVFYFWRFFVLRLRLNKGREWNKLKETNVRIELAGNSFFKQNRFYMNSQMNKRMLFLMFG